jgi:hypothetical protein
VIDDAVEQKRVLELKEAASATLRQENHGGMQGGMGDRYRLIELKNKTSS